MADAWKYGSNKGVLVIGGTSGIRYCVVEAFAHRLV